MSATSKTTADDRREAREWLDESIAIANGRIAEQRRHNGIAERITLADLLALSTLKAMIAEVPE